MKRIVKVNHSFRFIMLLSAILFGGLNCVWGGTWIGQVAVGAGKGSATVTVYSYPFNVQSKQDDATSTNSTLEEAKFKSLLGSTEGSIEYSASASAGYEFSGWYSSASCSGTASSTSSPWTAVSRTTSSKSVKYYAQFSPKTYTVTLNGNGGGSSSKKVTYDATYGDLPSSTRSGYTFAGWYTAATGGSQVTASTKVQTANDHTLYAHWTANSYDVTLKANGGVGDDQVVSATYNSKMPTKLKNGGDIVAPTKTGYSFTGYFKGDAKYYDNKLAPTNTKWTTVGNGTLLAGWQANTYTVSFNGNGGSNANNKTVTYDATYGTLPTSVRAGYTFAGWYTEAVGGTQIIASTTVKITAAQTLYAHWTANNYTITLNNQSATTAGTKEISVVYDSNANLTGAITLPTKTNCTFEGYFTAVKGGGSKLIDKTGNIIAGVSGYTDGSKNWKCANNVTLYAYWKQNQTITWDLADGASVEYATGELMGAEATSGLAITYTSNHPEWGYINEAGRLVVVEPNRTITITASQAGDIDWNAAESVAKTFVTLGAHPDQFTEVHATNITYGDLLSASNLSGKVYFQEVEIAGTLEWVDPSLMPNAGTANQMVLFTPDNQSAYSLVYFVVPVKVEKATPVIKWHVGNILHEQVRYSHFVESSNKEAGADFSFQTSDSELLHITGDVLVTGEISSKQSGWIKVSQPETENYKAYNATWSIKHDLTVYPKAGICLPFNPMTQEEFNSARIAITKPGGWCSTNEDGYRENYIAHIDVTYTQREGIALGSWEEGLSGLGDAIADWILGRSVEFDYSAKSVDFFFSGIPNKISFDVESQAVTTTPPSVTWPATAKNWHLFVSVDGETYTEVAHRTGDGSVNYTFTDENVRYVRITYNGNFTGFVKNLCITQKKYIRTDKETMTFGTEAYPLQAPQPLKISYSSLGVCGGSEEDAITITSTNPAFYVDESVITENVDIEESDEYTIYVRCNDVNQKGALHIVSNDGTVKNVQLESTKPYITTAATSIFETGTEHAPQAETNYRAKRTHDFSACFDGAKALYDTLYIYGVTESSAAERLWAYDAHRGYNVPAINVEEGNVHTPCFVYEKNDAQYDYVRTFDAATTTLNIAAGDKKLGFVGYKPASLATTIPAVQINGQSDLYLVNTEMHASGAAMVLNGTMTILAEGINSLTSANGAAVQLTSAGSQVTIEDSWVGETSAVLALRPSTGKPSIDLGSATGKVIVNGTQLELHNAVNLAIAHMNSGVEEYDGEVQINDGSIGGEAVLGMPKHTMIDGGTFNDGTVLAYTIKGFGKRPRNSRGDMLSRHTMSPEALADKYSWYGHAHLTTDDLAKVHPMLMDEVVCIFEGTVDEDSHNESNWTKWPAADDDVLINAPMIITGAEMKVKSLTINWVRGEHGQPAVTVAPDGGLTVGEGGIDGAVKDNLLLKAGTEGATKGQTGFLRIHPEPNSWELMPQANVELFSIGYYDMNSEEENVAAWQYVGVPVETSLLAKKFFTTSWIYSWNEEIGDWQNNRSTLVMQPFEGYATTQFMNKEGVLVSFAGTILDNKEYKVAVTANGKTDEKGYNALANSFTAPIDIAQFSTEDFSEGVDPTIYIFNTGSRTDAHQTVDIAEKAEAKGQYLAVPVNNVDAMKAAYKYPTVIAPMQGFCIKTEKEGTVTLNYERLVWNGNYSEHPNTPLRTPKKAVNLSTLGSLCVTISANGWSDNLYMLESESYDKAYEAGYDATKMNSGEFNVFAVEGESRLAVDATNNIIGTYVGVRTGEETTYTLSFSHLMTNNELFLLDKEANEIVDIYDGVEYTFYAEPNSEITDRFQILGREKAPEVTTAIEEAADNDGTKVHKFIKDNQLYILKNGVLYNATGARVY